MFMKEFIVIYEIILGYIYVSQREYIDCLKLGFGKLQFILFVNKILLEYRDVYLFIQYLWLFSVRVE